MSKRMENILLQISQFVGVTLASLLTAGDVFKVPSSLLIGLLVQVFLSVVIKIISCFMKKFKKEKLGAI